MVSHQSRILSQAGSGIGDFAKCRRRASAVTSVGGRSRGGGVERLHDRGGSEGNPEHVLRVVPTVRKDQVLRTPRLVKLLHELSHRGAGLSVQRVAGPVAGDVEPDSTRGRLH